MTLPRRHALLAALLILPVAALSAGADHVTRVDGTDLVGTVTKWTDHSIRINVRGMIMELNMAQVSRVSIEDSADCAREVVDARAALADGHLDEGVTNLIQALRAKPDCAGLGNIAVEYLKARSPELPGETFTALGQAGSHFAAVRDIVLQHESASKLPTEVMEQTAIASLQRGSGSDFQAALEQLHKIWLEELLAAEAKGDVKAVVRLWTRLAGLYSAPDKRITTSSEFTQNTHLNGVAQGLHAIDVIALPEKMALAPLHVRRLRAMQFSEMKSVQAAAREKLLAYFGDRGDAVQRSLATTGDYAAFAAGYLEWKGAIPEEIAGEPRLIKLNSAMQATAEREKEADAEYQRLLAALQNGDPMVLGEIGPQTLRFGSSLVWTAARRAELDRLKAELAEKLKPTPTPEPTKAAPTAAAPADPAAARPTPQPTAAQPAAGSTPAQPAPGAPAQPTPFADEGAPVQPTPAAPAVAPPGSAPAAGS